MPLSVSYSLTGRVASFLDNTSTSSGTQTDPVAFGLSSGTYVSLWSTPNSTISDVDANTLSATGASVSTGEYRANANDDVTGGQFDPAVAQITTGPNAGKILVTYTDTGSNTFGDIRLVQLNSSGTAPLTSTLVWQNSQFGKSDSSISALSNGGFVVTLTRITPAAAGTPGTDVIYQTYDSSLNPLGLKFVDSASNAMNDSSVAGLAGGGFVVAWEQTPDGGGAKTVLFQTYNNAGTATGIDSNHPDGTHVQIGSATSTALADIHARALSDGGFVVAYVVNNGGSANDIVARIYNADGSARTGTLNVNLTTAGDQDKPSVTVLSNGLFAVTWTDEATHQPRSYRALS